MTKRELFVGRLPSGLDASALRQMFEKFGTLSRCDLKTASQGTYGFVSYEDSKNAQDALDALHNTDVQGSKINVEWAKSRERPRGGGDRTRRYSPYNSRRRRSRSPSPRRDRGRSPRRYDRDRRDRSRSPRRDRRDDRRRDDRDRYDRRDDRRSRRSRSRSPVTSSRRRSRSRSPVEKRDSSRSPVRRSDATEVKALTPTRDENNARDRVTASPTDD